MKTGLHCWRVYFDYKDLMRAYMRHDMKRVIAPTVESAIATARGLILQHEATVTSVSHDGPIDGICSEEGK